MKLEKYKTFEGKYEDVNYEKEIDKVLDAIVQQKLLISMLGDTINHVSDTIEKTFPEAIEEFIDSLQHYEDSVYANVEEIKEKMIDGYPNLKDMIEEVEIAMSEIEKYLKNKKR